MLLCIFPFNIILSHADFAPIPREHVSSSVLSSFHSSFYALSVSCYCSLLLCVIPFLSSHCLQILFHIPGTVYTSSSQPSSRCYIPLFLPTCVLCFVSLLPSSLSTAPFLVGSGAAKPGPPAVMAPMTKPSSLGDSPVTSRGRVYIGKNFRGRTMSHSVPEVVGEVCGSSPHSSQPHLVLLSCTPRHVLPAALHLPPYVIH